MRTTAAILLTLLALFRPAFAGSPERSLRWAPQSTPPSAALDFSTVADAYDSDDDGDDAPERLSAGRAVGYSLLIPGLGDWYAGNHSRAIVSFGIEAAIWVGYFVSQDQASQREEAYRNYATYFAGVSSTGHSDDYYALLREYDNWEQYQADLILDARIEGYDGSLNPDLGAEALERYFVANRVSDFEPWQWQSLDNKVQFQEMRSASKNAERRSDYLIAAAVANRLVAAVFAYMSVRGANAANAEENASTGRYHIDFTPPREDYEAAVTLTRSF